MNLREEYETTLKVLHETASGQALLLEIQKISQKVAGEMVQSGTMGLVGDFIGVDGISKIFEENGVLCCGRLLKQARQYDQQPLDQRLSKAVDFITAVIEGAIRYDERLQIYYASSPLKGVAPDKRERKERRQKLAEADRKALDELRSEQEALTHQLWNCLLPDGEISVLLPSGAVLFAPGIRQALAKLKHQLREWIERLFSKETKVQLLWSLFRWFQQQIDRPWHSMAPLEASAKFSTPPSEPPVLKHEQIVTDPVPKNIVEGISCTGTDRLTILLPRMLEICFPSLGAYLPFLPCEAIVRWVLSQVHGMLNQYSCEEIVAKFCLLMLSSLRSSPLKTTVSRTDLERLVEKVCSDERIPLAVISQCMPAPDPMPLARSPFDFIAQALRSSIRERGIKNALDVIPWRQSLVGCCDRCQAYLFSTVWDRFCVDRLGLFFGAADYHTQKDWRIF